MKTFEYKMLPSLPREDELNELGRQGWELIIAQHGGKWVLKREIDPSLMRELPKNLASSSRMA
jgi:hypothetical protein